MSEDEQAELTVWPAAARVDHWADPGGQTVAALKELLSSRTGIVVPLLTVEIINTVEQLRDLTFGIF